MQFFITGFKALALRTVVFEMDEISQQGRDMPRTFAGNGRRQRGDVGQLRMVVASCPYRFVPHR